MERKQAKPIYVGSRTARGQTLPHDYAEACELYLLLSYATRIFLRKVHCQLTQNNIANNQVLPYLLQQCNRGEHVLLKSFGSFSKSVFSRSCFLYNFLKVFEVYSNLRNGLDYYQLSRLLCSDFPKEIIQRAVQFLLPVYDPTECMYKVVPSKRLISALYISLVYVDFVDSFVNGLYSNDSAKAVNIVDMLNWIKQNDVNTSRQNYKPSLAVLLQVLLSLLYRRHLVVQYGGVVFITEDNIDSFVKEAGSNGEIRISFKEFMSELVDSPYHCAELYANLYMFDNSQSWPTEAHKLLSVKEPVYTPINVKKNPKGNKK